MMQLQEIKQILDYFVWSYVRGINEKYVFLLSKKITNNEKMFNCK